MINEDCIGLLSNICLARLPSPPFAMSSIIPSSFSELSNVAGRFSEYAEDHLLLPNGFYTKEELKEKIVEVKEKLKK